MISEDVQIGMLVSVSKGCRNPNMRGRIGTVSQRYGDVSYAAFEVRFGRNESELGRNESELFWHHELEESEGVNGRPAS